MKFREYLNDKDIINERKKGQYDDMRENDMRDMLYNIYNDVYTLNAYVQDKRMGDKQKLSTLEKRITDLFKSIS